MKSWTGIQKASERSGQQPGNVLMIYWLNNSSILICAALQADLHGNTVYPNTGQIFTYAANN